MPIALGPFDPSRDFKTKTAFRAGGVLHPNRVPFDKSRVNERVLRQLYEARKIGYSDDPDPAKQDKRFSKLLRRFVEVVSRHSAVGTVSPPHIQGAPGTAREAPGAEESTSAESGSASAPQTTEADALVDEPAEEEAAAAPEGDAETAAAAPTREEQIEQLMVDHSLKQLLELASGIEGLPSKPSKQDVATALVDQRQAA